jgi:hypothetical protein
MRSRPLGKHASKIESQNTKESNREIAERRSAATTTNNLGIKVLPKLIISVSHLRFGKRCPASSSTWRPSIGYTSLPYSHGNGKLRAPFLGKIYISFRLNVYFFLVKLLSLGKTFISF